MAQQKPEAKPKPGKGGRSSVEPSVEQARADELLDLAPPFADIIAASGEGSVQSQAAQLGDKGLQRAQRQELAAQIGRRHGNSHLQRVVASLETKQTKRPTPVIEDATAVQEELGVGRPLEGGVRRSMEAAFGGADWSGVRVHTDDRAAELTRVLDAPAVTLGEDIAFRSGEYQPGTAVGEALLAHELAHVAQQRRPAAAEVQRDANAADALEADAQHTAVGAVVGLWQGLTGGWDAVRQSAMPRLRSGLQLQRCSGLSEEEKKKLEETKKILNQIPLGREALAIQKKHNVKIAFNPPGGGSGWNPDSNTVEIDKGKTATSAALTFVHEMNHAKYHHEGKTADVDKLGREEYVKKRVEEEAEGVVKSIEAKIELEEGTKIDVSKTGYPLEAEYRKAYKDAVDAAKAKDPKKSESELKKIGRAAGKVRVTKGFMDGEVIGSRHKKTYPQAYGDYWDSKHK